MHVLLQMALIWSSSFLTLGAAIVLLSVFGSVIGNDLELKSIGQEALLATIASLIEAVFVLLLLTLLPPASRLTAARAMIIPLLMVGLIYQLVHCEEWNRSDAPLLLLFQVAIASFFGCLFAAQFQMALTIVIGLGLFLALFAVFARSL
jgi:hypothetical protein